MQQHRLKDWKQADRLFLGGSISDIIFNEGLVQLNRPFIFKLCLYNTVPSIV